MESRGLRALLSPSEELTLRRIALGISQYRDLPSSALSRLQHLGLVDEANRLTLDGVARYEALPRPQKAATLSERRLITLLAAMNGHNKA
jgi:hypothetical protein